MTGDVGTTTLVIRYTDDQIDALDRPFFFAISPSVLKKGFWKLDFF